MINSREYLFTHIWFLLSNFRAVYLVIEKLRLVGYITNRPFVYLIKFMSKLQTKNGDRILLKVITDKLETTEPNIFRNL